MCACTRIRAHTQSPDTPGPTCSECQGKVSNLRIPQIILINTVLVFFPAVFPPIEIKEGVTNQKEMEDSIIKLEDGIKS